MKDWRVSTCRTCLAGCGIRVEVENGRPVRIVGDQEDPVHAGFTCPKGRQLPAQHAHPNRLLHSQRRSPGGSYEQVSTTQALDEIADRLTEIVQRHGPRAIATYKGTAASSYPAGLAMMTSWLDAIGSPMNFTSRAIDQPAKFLAGALMGTWEAGPQTFSEADVWFFVGANPPVSMWGCSVAPYNPLRRLLDAREAGMKVIVADPRRTESARLADIHLQVKPGEDPTLLSGILRVILDERLHDEAFAADNIVNLDALQSRVRQFDLDYVERRTHVPGDLVRLAAQTFANADRGCISSGTGPDMAGRGTLTEYLIGAINFVCGRVRRAGEVVPNPTVLAPPLRHRAQTTGPRPVAGFGEQLRSRPLGMSAAGMPTAALPDEILYEGEGAVRALIVNGGNPAVAWPDQLKSVDALQKLDLLVTIDPTMSATARIAHFVIAPKLSLEVPGITIGRELLRDYGGQGHGHGEPYAAYSPAIVDTPPGADLLEEWEFFYELGRRMQLDLTFAGCVEPLRYAERPTTDELLDLLCTGGRVSLAEVKKHPHGALFPEPPTVVLDKDPSVARHLEFGSAEMMRVIDEIRHEPFTDGAGYAAGDSSTHRLISRRMRNVYNSSGTDMPELTRRQPYNPAYLHPDDCTSLGVASGDLVDITTARATITATVEEADDVPTGVVSIAHCWGGLPSEDHLFRGANTSRLISNTDEIDPWVGLPRMSAIPVTITPRTAAADHASWEHP